MSKMIVSPSILAADLSELKSELDHTIESGADWVHIDVMDGHFVPNLSFGLPVIESIRKAFPKLFLDVHIMVENPDESAIWYAESGADLVTFHFEAAKHPHRIIQSLQGRCKAGVALNPGTPVEFIEPLIADLDLLLIMSVNPGFGGQGFIKNSLKRIRQARGLIDAADSKAYLQVDGGVTDKNAAALAEAGANNLVAGSYIFNSSDRKSAIASLR